uniref:Phospholipid phosphatase related 5 n=1 Tax=Anas platyrhynchos platyrhynchos TaxID=8840 RepID=A0A493TP06_ANAPP
VTSELWLLEGRAAPVQVEPCPLCPPCILGAVPLGISKWKAFGVTWVISPSAETSLLLPGAAAQPPLLPVALPATPFSSAPQRRASSTEPEVRGRCRGAEGPLRWGSPPPSSSSSSPSSSSSRAGSRRGGAEPPLPPPRSARPKRCRWRWRWRWRCRAPACPVPARGGCRRGAGLPRPPEPPVHASALSAQQHALLPDGDHGRDRDAGLLLRVHRHLRRQRAGLLLLRGRVPQALPGPGGQQRRAPGAPLLADGGRARAGGIYAFGLFATDIFVNAGQVVTGNLAPHFLALCKPNYTALGCKQYTQFISSAHACTGNPDLIMKARKTFPSKEAALSVYAAMYLAMYITSTVKARGTRLAKPVLCLGLMCLAFLTGINRVAEYRNHWSDVIAGFVIGISIAVFLVSVYLCHFCWKNISILVCIS